VSFIVEAANKSSTTYTIHTEVSNDIPRNILLSNSKVDENMGSALVGNFSTVTENPNDSHVYSLVEEHGTPSIRIRFLPQFSQIETDFLSGKFVKSVVFF